MNRAHDTRKGGENNAAAARTGSVMLTPGEFVSDYVCSSCLLSACGLRDTALARAAAAVVDADAADVVDDAALFDQPQAAKLARMCQLACVPSCAMARGASLPADAGFVAAGTRTKAS